MSEAQSKGVPAGVELHEDKYHVGTLAYTGWGLVRLFCWLLWGDLVWTLMEAVVPNVLPLKLGELKAEWLIPIFQATIPAVLVVALCPVISFRSDRYRSRLGRRIPYLLWTTPLLSVCLMLFGLSDILGHSLYGPVTKFLGIHITENTMILVLMALFLIGWRFGETYANTIYWYLFNDVVPHGRLAQFNSLFRVVGNLVGIAYWKWVFPKSMEHFAYIFVGAGALYLFGFGLMCLKVKEGEYPPPPENVDKRRGLISSIRTYAKECFTHKFYWYFFLMNAFFSVSWLAGQSYNLLRNTESLKLDMQTLGDLGSWTLVATLVMLPPLGWLADKLNPIRVFVVMGFVLFVNPLINCVFIFWDFGPSVNLIILYVLALVILPFDAMQDTVTMPMYMRLLPKDRYGQFASANGTLRALARIGLSLLVAPVWYILIKAFGRDMAFRMFPLWTIVLQVPALVCLVLLYREWKHLGGKDNYVPPQV